jgi:outer membrane immunogenic protein
VRVGYDWRVGSNVIVGALIEVAKTGVSDSTTAFSTTPASYTFTRESEYVAALRGRIGFAPGPRGLVYLTGGVAASKMDNSFTSTNTANSFTPNNADEWAMGYQAGGGLQFSVTPAIWLGLEYLYNEFTDDEYSVTVGTGAAGATNPFAGRRRGHETRRRSLQEPQRAGDADLRLLIGRAGPLSVGSPAR